MALLCTRVGLTHFRSILCSRISPVRTISIKGFIIRKTTLKPPAEFDIKQFSMLYGFKFAAGIGYLKRCRRLKNLFLALLLASTAYYTYTGQIPLKDGCFLVIIGVELFFIYYLLATKPKNIIGKIYINANKTQLAFSYVNDCGRRANVVCRIDGMKISDHPNLGMNNYFKKITIMETGLELDFYFKAGKKIYNELDYELLFQGLK